MGKEAKEDRYKDGVKPFNRPFALILDEEEEEDRKIFQTKSAEFSEVYILYSLCIYTSLLLEVFLKSIKLESIFMKSRG
jgi:hypothetical protein